LLADRPVIHRSTLPLGQQVDDVTEASHTASTRHMQRPRAWTLRVARFPEQNLTTATRSVPADARGLVPSCFR
jgi:hypothetical protein